MTYLCFRFWTISSKTSYRNLQRSYVAICDSYFTARIPFNQTPTLALLKHATSHLIKAQCEFFRSLQRKNKTNCSEFPVTNTRRQNRLRKQTNTARTHAHDYKLALLLFHGKNMGNWKYSPFYIVSQRSLAGHHIPQTEAEVFLILC